jgi:hypothetical protein
MMAVIRSSSAPGLNPVATSGTQHEGANLKSTVQDGIAM